jgi:hypothetical protein
MLYGLSRNLCQNSAKIVRTVQKYTQKYIAAATSISVPTNVVWQPWNACQYSQKLQLLSSSISVHITCCMTSTNPYGTACSSLLSEIRTSLCFGMCSLLRQMLSLFSAQPLSCSLLFSQQECCNFLVLGISPRILASHQESLALSTRMLHLTFLILGISPRTSWHLTKISSLLCLLLSQQDCCFFFFFGISPRASWHLTKSLFKQDSSLLLASHQEPLGISPRVSCFSCSWHLTKSLWLHFFLLLASHQEPLGISPRVSCFFFLTQEWVRPLALINLMREGEEFSNLTVEIRSDGWLRFGVSSLTLTLIIKLSFNLHLTN